MRLTSEREAVIEAAAKDVLIARDAYRLPVNPLAIAAAEGIKMAPGSYDDCFDGRIEYHLQVGKFILFYAVEGPGRTEGRIRFSVGHELGHYYLENHRQYLLSGTWHGSHAGFVSDSQLEREADHFAASLLMPSELFYKEVLRWGRLNCSLRDLCTLSDRLKTSLISTAIRYCQGNFEATSIVLSRGGKVLFQVPSEDMRRCGLGFIPYGTPVPSTSITARLGTHPSTASQIVEGEVDAEVWFERGYSTLWEEAMILGHTGLTLTYLGRNRSSAVT